MACFLISTLIHKHKLKDQAEKQIMDSLTNYQAGYNLINDFLINHSSTSHVSDDTDDTFRLKLRLEYFFMDPLKKWEKRKTKPWKLLVQIIKLVIFTYQLILFGSDMAKFITYQDEMQTTLKTLLLRGWQPTADAIAYPGPYVPYAVYTKQDFFDSMNFAIKAYSNVPQTSVGTFGFPNTNQSEVPPVRVCVTHLLQADFEPSQFRYNYSMFTKEDCTFIDEKSKPEIETWNQFKVENLNLIDFKKMVLVTIELPLRSLLIEDATSGDEGIVCFEVENKILYDNRHRDGQVVVDLFSLPKRFDCQGSLKESSGYLISRLVINIFVISIATLSCALCVRSLWRAFWLAKCTDLVLRTKGKALTFSDKLEFCDGWLILIIINDIMIASATAILSLYNERLLETSNYTICSLLLGVGNFLSWAGLLRYLSFFRQYNILLLTLKKSFPHVMRFMLCTMLIYW